MLIKRAVRLVYYFIYFFKPKGLFMKKKMILLTALLTLVCQQYAMESGPEPAKKQKASAIPMLTRHEPASLLTLCCNVINRVLPKVEFMLDDGDKLVVPNYKLIEVGGLREKVLLHVDQEERKKMVDVFFNKSVAQPPLRQWLDPEEHAYFLAYDGQTYLHKRELKILSRMIEWSLVGREVGLYKNYYPLGSIILASKIKKKPAIESKLQEAVMEHHRECYREKGSFFSAAGYFDLGELTEIFKTRKERLLKLNIKLKPLCEKVGINTDQLTVEELVKLDALVSNTKNQKTKLVDCDSIVQNQLNNLKQNRESLLAIMPQKSVITERFTTYLSEEENMYELLTVVSNSGHRPIHFF
jgi:hypothetical protein